MAETSITVEGFPEMMRALELIEDGKYIQPILKSIGETVKKKAKKYPPKSAANFPPAPYYKRSVGTVRADGTDDRSSQRLGDQWYVTPGQWAVLIGNPVTYAPYVHGPEQVAIHGQRGWQQLLPTAEAELPEIMNQMWSRINRIWATARL